MYHLSPETYVLFIFLSFFFFRLKFKSYKHLAEEEVEFDPQQEKYSKKKHFYVIVNRTAISSDHLNPHLFLCDFNRQPSCLCPTDDESIKLVEDLHSQALPCFSSSRYR